jgi:hypothetical protein
MRYRAELIAGAIALGAVLRMIALPLAGSTDMRVFKTWGYFAATQGVGSLYGTGSHFPERRTLRLWDVQTKIDYPPLALYELGAASRAYLRWTGGYADTPALTASIKSLDLLADLAIALLIVAIVRRHAPHADALGAMLTFWLNPAAILAGAVLGYLDPLYVLPALGALVAATADRAILAGVLVAVAGLTKPLALLFAPALLIAIWNAGPPAARWRRLAAMTAGAAAIAAAIVAPIVVAGGLGNAAWGVGSLLRDPFLTGDAANLWWLLAQVLPQPPLDVLRAIGAALTLAAAGWAAWRARRATSIFAIAAVAAFCAHAYGVLAVSVHENHLYAAIPPLVVVAAGRPRFTPILVAVSAIVALNLDLFYGLGVYARHLAPRAVGGVATAGILASCNCAALAWHAVIFRRET